MLWRRRLFVNPLVGITADTINGMFIINILRRLTIPFPYGQGRTSIGLEARLRDITQNTEAARVVGGKLPTKYHVCYLGMLIGILLEGCLRKVQ